MQDCDTLWKLILLCLLSMFHLALSSCHFDIKMKWAEVFGLLFLVAGAGRSFASLHVARVLPQGG